jgi:lipopolysaccharide heptosyltransferase II
VAAAVRRKWPGAARWIALQPGARWRNKRWPAEHFAALVGALAPAQAELRFVILGDAGDRPLGELIAAAVPDRCLNLCGETTLLEMVEWMRRCELLITNDTGPMHAAAALGRPLLALFGPTEPRRTGPYGQLHRVLRLDLPCSPCLKPRCHHLRTDECLQALSPAQVLAQLQPYFV